MHKRNVASSCSKKLADIAGGLNEGNIYVHTHTHRERYRCDYSEVHVQSTMRSLHASFSC